MRKEELLFKKSEAVKNIQWYVKNVLTDEDLKAFSIPQLEKNDGVDGPRGEFPRKLRAFLHTVSN